MLVIAVVALRHPTSKSTSADTSSSHATSTAGSAGSTKPSPAPSTGASSRAGSSEAAAKSIPLVVLNNTTTTHLAKDAADLFEQAGWKVSSYGNYTNDIVSTCAYYDPNYPGAQAAASLLQQEFPSIVRVKPKFSGLAAGPIVVVLTPGFKTS